MEVIYPSQLYKSLKRYWRRRKYQRLHGVGKRNVRVVRLGGGKDNRRVWKVRTVPRLRLKQWIPFLSPVKILARLRDAYMAAMLGFEGKAGSLHSGADSTFGANRDPPKRRSGKVSASSAEAFEARLLLEMCKSIVASRELAAIS